MTAWSSATTGTRPWCPCSSTPRSPQAHGHDVALWSSRLTLRRRSSLKKTQSSLVKPQARHNAFARQANLQPAVLLTFRRLSKVPSRDPHSSTRIAPKETQASTPQTCTCWQALKPKCLKPRTYTTSTPNYIANPEPSCPKLQASGRTRSPPSSATTPSSRPLRARGRPEGLDSGFRAFRGSKMAACSKGSVRVIEGLF